MEIISMLGQVYIRVAVIEFASRRSVAPGQAPRPHQVVLIVGQALSLKASQQVRHITHGDGLAIIFFDVSVAPMGSNAFGGLVKYEGRFRQRCHPDDFLMQRYTVTCMYGTTGTVLRRVIKRFGLVRLLPPPLGVRAGGCCCPPAPLMVPHACVHTGMGSRARTQRRDPCIGPVGSVEGSISGQI